MVDDAIAKRIARERRRGSSLREIADGLNGDRVRDGSWRGQVPRLDREGRPGTD
jgi:hypothetical protein